MALGLRVVAVAVVVAMVVVMGGRPVEAQLCSSQLGNLNVCAPFVVPGAGNQPSTECCTALGAVQHECICNTLQIASRLPSLCNLPALSCGAN